MRRVLGGAAALALLVGACGYTEGERVSGGAAAGAATGAGVGALGGPVGALAGAAIGGVAGGVTGGVTEPSELNLGRPPWTNPQTEVDFDRNDGRRRGAVASRSGGSGQAQMASANVREIQRELNQRGYSAGPVDGVWGAQTSRAASAFQRANNMPTTGQPDASLRQALNVGDAAQTATPARDRPAGTATGATTSPGAGTTGAMGGGTGASPPASMNPSGGSQGMGTTR